MTFTNESLFDRAIRILLGIALVLAAWIAWPGMAAITAFAFGAIALLTGFAGWCPAYTLFGISTAEKTGA